MERVWNISLKCVSFIWVRGSELAELMRRIHICQKKKSLFPYARLQGPNASWGIVDQKKSARLQVSLISYISLQEPLFANPILRASASKHRSARFPSAELPALIPRAWALPTINYFHRDFPFPPNFICFLLHYSLFPPLFYPSHRESCCAPPSCCATRHRHNKHRARRHCLFSFLSFSFFLTKYCCNDI